MERPPSQPEQDVQPALLLLFWGDFFVRDQKAQTRLLSRDAGLQQQHGVRAFLSRLLDIHNFISRDSRLTQCP